MQDYRKMAVWNRAHRPALEVYVASKNLPQSESFGLALNLRRSVVGMATRIADGAGRTTDAEFAMELKKWLAAAFELDYLLLLSKDLGFLTEPSFDALSAELAEVTMMLSVFLRRLSPAN